MQKSTKPLINHITDFLEYCEVEKGLAPLTIKNYDRFLNSFRAWLSEHKLNSIKPHELTTKVIWDYRLSLSKRLTAINAKYLEKSTQTYYLIALRSLLSFFAEKDIVSLPSDKIKLPKSKTNERLIKFLTIEQIDTLFQAPDVKTVPGLRDRAILELLFSTGMRVAELANLQKSDIPKNKDKGCELSIRGKGSHIRTIYISERAYEWLMRSLDARRDEEKALFIGYRGKKQDVAGGALTTRSVERIVKKYAMQAGLPVKVTPHVLRHSYATDLLLQGVDLRIIQEFLGHRNIATTQMYTHITNKALRDIHQKFHSGQRLKS
ncbi:MAG TPA: tyrosine-type recombinase/integrase [Patescibacteria group bacterium]|nr:tyrosine-type recombinase/integrase [Patescibacteria group bacterium]